MALEPFVLNLDIDPGTETVDDTDGKVHLTHLHQNADYEGTLSLTIDGTPLDFSAYSRAVMTVRDYARASKILFTVDSDSSEIDLDSDSLTFRISAAKTDGMDLPKDLPETPFPLKINLGHDVRLYRAGGEIEALCYGIIELVLAYTRT